MTLKMHKCIKRTTHLGCAGYHITPEVEKRKRDLLSGVFTVTVAETSTQTIVSPTSSVTRLPSALLYTAKMSMFRAKRLDLGCFVNIKVIRDHTKRKVFAEHEPERYVSSFLLLLPLRCTEDQLPLGRII